MGLDAFARQRPSTVSIENSTLGVLESGRRPGVEAFVTMESVLESHPVDTSTSDVRNSRDRVPFIGVRNETRVDSCELGGRFATFRRFSIPFAFHLELRFAQSKWSTAASSVSDLNFDRVVETSGRDFGHICESSNRVRRVSPRIGKTRGAENTSRDPDALVGARSSLVATASWADGLRPVSGYE